METACGAQLDHHQFPHHNLADWDKRQTRLVEIEARPDLTFTILHGSIMIMLVYVYMYIYIYMHI